MYLRKIWFLPLLLAVSIESSPSPQPPYDYQSTTRSVPAVVPKVVYTADRIRDEPRQDRIRDSDLFPSTATTGTARTSHGGDGDISAEEPENTGFVEPIDFSSLLSGVGNYNDKQNIAAESSPFVTAESKDAFAGFFGNSKNTFVEPNFGSISTASSNQNSQKTDEDEVGFVDPNVQFRSLFDSTETAAGFKPQDFLNHKDDSTGVDPSKGSQTRAYPSFTYSGRQNDDGGYGPSSDKYRSSFRQVGSPESYEQDRPTKDPYDDRNFYNGERDRSPPPPQNPRYNHAPSAPQRAQATAHTPKVAPKAAESNSPRCKKVEKQVDTNDDYAAYTDPEPDYDPSTYGSRYKRQDRGGRGNKRPMTCYVCEDEEGRYAERCSYDSKADPNKKGNYYHSTSSSFNDKGNRRPSGGRERLRRNPSLKAAATASSATTTPTVSTTPTTQDPLEGPLEEPKRLDKRQSDRFASNNGNNRDNNERGRNDNNNNEFRGFDAPNRGGQRLGNQQERNAGFDDDFERDDFGERREAGSENRDRSNNDRSRDDDFGVNDYDGTRGRENTGRENTGRENIGRSSLESEFGVPSNNRENNRRQDEYPNYGFVEPIRQSSTRGGGRNSNFNFGPPRDFGRDASASNVNNQGFNFDFSIPRDFDPDIQLRTANSNPSPNLHGSASSNNDGPGFAAFDSGYDDYIKKYFPDAFGSSTPASSPSSSSFKPSHGPPSHSPPSHRVPDKEHTQQNAQFHPPPPPYFQHEGNGEHLEKLVGAFSSRDRNGCEKVIKGDMTCYVCRDPRGMQKEECMYASNDPKNKKMAYHEVTEYSSLPPASILPRPELASAASSILASSTPSSARSPLSHSSLPSASPTTSSSHSHITKESRVIETKVKKSPLDYDFDY